MSRLLVALIICFAISHVAFAAPVMLPVTVNPSDGKVLLEVRSLDQDLIYTSTLATGLGATSPLLDRGQLGDNALVRFERHGPRVLLVRQNETYRAQTDNDALARSVAESFPRSVLASFEIVEDRRGVLVVDATSFLLSDVYGIEAALQRAGRGRASLDRSRSFVDATQTGAFERNTEIRSVLTYSVAEPDAVLRQHAPDGRSVTFEHQHSFIALPEAGYQPRVFHPRSGMFPHVFFDFAMGLDTDYRQRWIWRWRLVPSDKQAYLRGELVVPEQPIIYYLDPAIPEPYRTAFREGGLWYNQLFEEAGFRDAFRILDLPEGASPMDARYNMIHWVHRSARGPSVGPSYRDPRSGEIIRTIVRMDSYRSLVNHDIWMGFRPAFGSAAPAMTSEEMAMARRRQHSAHEIGHTLGFAHNFIAATQGRASVMDYPVPLVRIDEDGGLDLSSAYAEGPGEFDRFAVRYAYTWYPNEASEREGLASIIREADAAGLRFITGGDASPDGSIPDATTWVEGENMLAALERTTAVRERLIAAFDERALVDGEPYWFLNKRFAHVYLHHRTALQGTIKYVGGLDFHYALAGEGIAPTRRIPAAEQRRALGAVIAAIQPAQLSIPDRIGSLIPPVPHGWSSGWMWSGETAPITSDAGDVFNPVHVAHSLAQEVVDGLLHPQRVNRMTDPSANEVINTVISGTWGVAGRDQPALRRVAQRAVLDALLDLAGDSRSSAGTRAVAEQNLSNLQRALERGSVRGLDTETGAHRELAARDIARYFAGDDTPEKRQRPAPIPLPWP